MTLPARYRKLVVRKPGPEFAAATAIVEVAMPEPGPGQVLVRNHYAGVNASDPVFASGGYGQADLPFDVGLESSGEIVAVGAGVTALKVGDHVLVSGFGGGYAEYRVAAAEHVVPVPRASAEITSVFIAGLTASVGLSVVGEMGAGETVLVTAAAGGVGSYAVQLARMAGNRVIGTCGDERKLAQLQSLGCERVINYRQEDVAAVLAAEYPGGVDLVFENVGRRMFDIALEHLACKGRLVCVGAVSEYAAGLGWERVEGVRIYQRLLATSASVRGFYLPHFAEHYAAHLELMLGQMAQGRLRAQIDPTRFSGIDAVVDAVAHLQSGRNLGKVVVDFTA